MKKDDVKYYVQPVFSTHSVSIAKVRIKMTVCEDVVQVEYLDKTKTVFNTWKKYLHDTAKEALIALENNAEKHINRINELLQKQKEKYDGE